MVFASSFGVVSVAWCVLVGCSWAFGSLNCLLIFLEVWVYLQFARTSEFSESCLQDHQRYQAIGCAR